MALVIKNPPANAGDTKDMGLISGLGRSHSGGNGNSLQYSCLENSMDRGAWWATVHGVSELGTTEHTYTNLKTNLKKRQMLKLKLPRTRRKFHEVRKIYFNHMDDLCLLS